MRTIQKWKDLNHWSSLVDMLLYLECRRLITIDRSILKERGTNLKEYFQKLIEDWKTNQENEYREAVKD